MGVLKAVLFWNNKHPDFQTPPQQPLEPEQLSDFFCSSTPTSPSLTKIENRPWRIGDEPCRLNGTTQALREPVEGAQRKPSPDRPGGLTLPLRPSASHHRQRIPVRQLSEDYIVPDNLGQHPGPGLVTPYLKQAWGPFQAHAAGQHAILGGEVQQGEFSYERTPSCDYQSRSSVFIK